MTRMIYKTSRLVIALAELGIGVLMLSAPAAGQTASATVTGTVKDETDAVARSVNITIIDTATTLQRETTTSEVGRFAIPDLPPGHYTLSADLKGFTTLEVRNLVLNVGDRIDLILKLQVAKVGESVTVNAEPSRVSTSAAVSTVIDRHFAETLPLNGRSFQSLLTTIPGVIFTGASQSGAGQFSVNGQRTNANYFTVDGVGANAEAGSNYWPASEIAGITPAFNALGGTQSLVSVDALEEFSVQTSTYSAKFGRQAGAQVSLVSRAGTNQFHGSAFEYFRHNKLDAVDWFVKANNLPQAKMRQNQFGGTMGGPLDLFGYNGRNRTFFFVSYEGLRLLQPRTINNDVPALSLREQAWPALKPLLASVPAPTGPENPVTRTAPFIASWSAPGSFDAGSVRLDHQLSNRGRLFGRFNYSPSQADTRTLNNVTRDMVKQRTLTLGWTQTVDSSIMHDLRFNETYVRRPYESWQDNLGGATPIPVDAIRPIGIPASTPQRIQIHLAGVASPYYTIGQFQAQHQFNLVDTWTWTKKSHLVDVGVDYRQLRPASQPWEYFLFTTYTADALLTGIPSGGNIQAMRRIDFRLHNFSAFVNDTWRLAPRFTIDAGLRWEMNPAPTMAAGNAFVNVLGLDNPANLRLSPKTNSLYPTDFKAFAPRLGVAYLLSQKAGWERTVRGGFGLFYDIGFGEGGRAALYYPFTAMKARPSIPYPFDANSVAPPLVTPGPPFNNASFIAFPDHKSPVTYEGNISVEQALGRAQTVTLSYVAARGRNLLRREQYIFANANIDFQGNTNVDVNASTAMSDYNALQVQYRRRLSRGLQAQASYTLSKSNDTVSGAISQQPRADKLDPALFFGASDFDRRNVLAAALTYQIPAPASGILRSAVHDWTLSSIVQIQSAVPVNIYISRDIGFGSNSSIRPDLVPGMPIYLDDPKAPGGWRLNPAAFSVPVELRMGNLPRNGIRGFPLRQVDLSLSRQVPVGEHMKAQLRVDAFNVFNIDNFGTPSGFLGSVSASGVFTPSSSFGVASWMMDNTLGGLNGLYRLYASGGPRSIQFSTRLTF